MAEERITVRAQILALESVAQKQVILRDHDAEKQVKQELVNKLKADGTYENMKPEEFQSLYRKKLRSYADYIGERYVREDDDGAPGLLVSKLMWENELRIRYTVGNRDHTQTVTYCTETNCLRAGGDFFVTVDRNQPRNILRQSLYDYREEWERRREQDSGGPGCIGTVVIGLIVMMLLYAAGILK